MIQLRFAARLVWRQWVKSRLHDFAMFHDNCRNYCTCYSIVTSCRRCGTLTSKPRLLWGRTWHHRSPGHSAAGCSILQAKRESPWPAGEMGWWQKCQKSSLLPERYIELAQDKVQCRWQTQVKRGAECLVSGMVWDLFSTLSRTAHGSSSSVAVWVPAMSDLGGGGGGVKLEVSILLQYMTDIYNANSFSSTFLISATIVQLV